jgi:hypothetical protein
MQMTLNIVTTKNTFYASRLQCVCDNNIFVTNTHFVQHLKTQKKIYASPCTVGVTSEIENLYLLVIDLIISHSMSTKIGSMGEALH